MCISISDEVGIGGSATKVSWLMRSFIDSCLAVPCYCLLLDDAADDDYDDYDDDDDDDDEF